MIACHIVQDRRNGFIKIAVSGVKGSTWLLFLAAGVPGMVLSCLLKPCGSVLFGIHHSDTRFHSPGGLGDVISSHKSDLSRVMWFDSSITPLSCWQVMGVQGTEGNPWVTLCMQAVLMGGHSCSGNVVWWLLQCFSLLSTQHSDALCRRVCSDWATESCVVDAVSRRWGF